MHTRAGEHTTNVLASFVHSLAHVYQSGTPTTRSNTGQFAIGHQTRTLTGCIARLCGGIARGRRSPFCTHRAASASGRYSLIPAARSAEDILLRGANVLPRRVDEREAIDGIAAEAVLVVAAKDVHAIVARESRMAISRVGLALGARCRNDHPPISLDCANERRRRARVLSSSSISHRRSSLARIVGRSCRHVPSEKQYILAW